MEKADGAKVLVPNATTATGHKGKTKTPKKELTLEERSIETKLLLARRDVVKTTKAEAAMGASAKKKTKLLLALHAKLGQVHGRETTSIDIKISIG
jgi:hypothetical protein